MINFGNGFIKISLDWQQFKALANSKALKIQHVIEPETSSSSSSYEIFAIDDKIVYCTVIFQGDIPVVCDVDQVTNDSHKTDFETNYLSKSNKRLSSETQDNSAMMVTQVGREGEEYTVATINFCDATTWYYTSTRHDSMTLSSSDAGTTFSLSGSNDIWVDMYHGKYFQEYITRDFKDHKYEIVVTVDDVTQSMRTPFETSGGDYVVNYRSGSISFASPITGSEVVKASYNKVVDSEFCLEPSAGNYLDVEEVEVQFTSDADMKGRIVFEVQGYVQFFAPEMCEIYGGPLPLNYLVTLQKTWYDTFYQLIDEALGAYPVIPAIGGNSGRGTQHATYGFPMRYATVRRMLSTYGIRSCVYIENHTEFGGERATATFYCVQNKEIVQ